ncbi:MAG: hypothetical protein LC122_09610 [Chitinophagales bacterium]|nr:hypothetical protein [Chitinophagales bacterium]
MKVLYFFLLVLGIFINLITSRFGLASQVSKIDCSKLFLTNPDIFYITNIIFFILLLGLSFLLNFPFWVVLLCYLLSYFIGRKWFWDHLRNSYERLEKVAPIRDDDGKILTTDKIIQQFKDGYRLTKRIEKKLK